MADKKNNPMRELVVSVAGVCAYGALLGWTGGKWMTWSRGTVDQSMDLLIDWDGCLIDQSKKCAEGSINP